MVAQIGEKQWENQIFVVTETFGTEYIYIATVARRRGERGGKREKEEGKEKNTHEEVN